MLTMLLKIYSCDLLVSTTNRISLRASFIYYMGKIKIRETDHCFPDFMEYRKQ